MREFGSEFPAIILPDGYFNSFFEFGREVTYLRSGRETLLYVAINISKDEEKKILVPSYCCWSMSSPFEKLGWKIVYYRLNEDLTVDCDYFNRLLREERPQAVMTMNFFGSSDTSATVSLVKDFDSNIKIIEDFSHCTFCFKKIFNDKVDFYVSSIRKSIGVCDGAVVLSKDQTDHSYIQEDMLDFSTNRFLAQVEKGKYFWTKDQYKKEYFWGLIRECEGIINEFNVVRPISKRAMDMLSGINGAIIAFARRENMRHLWALLKGKVDMVPGIERSFEGAPFSLPILVDNQVRIQKELAQKGLYTQLLWPICEDAQKKCPVSKMMGERMLSVPIDQRYSWDDIEDISKIILEVLQK